MVHRARGQTAWPAVRCRNAHICRARSSKADRSHLASRFRRLASGPGRISVSAARAGACRAASDARRDADPSLHAALFQLPRRRPRRRPTTHSSRIVSASRKDLMTAASRAPGAPWASSRCWLLLGGGGWYAWQSGAMGMLSDRISSAKEGEQVPTVAAPADGAGNSAGSGCNAPLRRRSATAAGRGRRASARFQVREDGGVERRQARVPRLVRRSTAPGSAALGAEPARARGQQASRRGARRPAPPARQRRAVRPAPSA